MLNPLPIKPNSFKRSPALQVLDTAFADMYWEVLNHPRIETAWGLAGNWHLNQDGLVDRVTVTNVIPPAGDVTRNIATASLGGDHQVAALEWLYKNYQANLTVQQRQNREVVFGYLYKGHSHHELNYHQYSGTDFSSIHSAVSLDGLEVAVGPLANIHQNETLIKHGNHNDGVIEVEGKHRVSFKFYFLTRAMVNNGQRDPIILEPVIVSAADLMYPPPQLSWQFINRAEYLEQIAHLETYGCTVTVTHRNADASDAALEIEFLVTKPTWRGTLQIITQPDYPHSTPSFKVIAPQSSPSQVAIFHSHSPQLDNQPLWQPGEDFIQAVFRLEARGEL